MRKSVKLSSSGSRKGCRKAAGARKKIVSRSVTKTGRTPKRRASEERGRRGQLLLTSEEKFSIAGIFTCVIDTESGSNRELLNRLFDRLELNHAEKERLFNLSTRDKEPGLFAKAIRGKTTRWLVLAYFLSAVVNDGAYDAREREGLRKMAKVLHISWDRITKLEDELASKLRLIPGTGQQQVQGTPGRRWKIVAGAVAGAVVAVAMLPVAAPAMGAAIGTYCLGLSGAAATSAGLATLGGGTVAAGGFGMAGGSAVVGTGLGLFGAGLVGRKVAKRTGSLNEFKYEGLDGQGLHTYIAVPGFLTQKSDLKAVWSPLPRIAGHGEHYVLRWESQCLLDLGKTLGQFAIGEAAKRAMVVWVKRGSKVVARKLIWPKTLSDFANLIDHPWQVAKDRTEKAAEQLASHLVERAHGSRPVSLIGFSLGSRLIFRTLEKLAERGEQGAGVVDHVVLMGSAIHADIERWKKVRQVVAGRLVNAYCENDWTLGLLYRAAEFTFGEVAGIAPVKLAGVENRNISHLVDGHLVYQDSIDKLLSYIGVDGA